MYEYPPEQLAAIKQHRYTSLRLLMPGKILMLLQSEQPVGATSVGKLFDELLRDAGYLGEVKARLIDMEQKFSNHPSAVSELERISTHEDLRRALIDVAPRFQSYFAKRAAEDLPPDAERLRRYLEDALTAGVSCNCGESLR